jgi:hypothetical protein
MYFRLNQLILGDVVHNGELHSPGIFLENSEEY